MAKTYKVVLSDKIFGREVDVAFKGSLKECLNHMNDKKLYRLLDNDHYVTRDRLFKVGIAKCE